MSRKDALLMVFVLLASPTALLWILYNDRLPTWMRVGSVGALAVLAVVGISAGALKASPSHTPAIVDWIRALRRIRRGRGRHKGSS
jgi:hypothetical protein